MKKWFTKIIYFIGFFSAVTARASDFQPPGGARAVGLGGASVTLTDVWAITNNIAGIAKLAKPVLGASAETRFGITAFNTVGMQGVLPLKIGAIGAEVSRFGDKIYNEQQIGVGYAHKLGPVQLGIKASLLQVHLEELGSKRVVTFSIGGQSEIIPKLTFGAHIFNLNQAKLADYQSERLPTIMKAGLGYKPNDKVLLCLESEKNIDLPADFKGGIEYNIVQKLTFRTGFSTANKAVTGGVGFKAKALQVDFGLGNQSSLGFRNQLALSYKFN